jgi:YihY family inner membrane protein
MSCADCDEDDRIDRQSGDSGAGGSWGRFYLVQAFWTRAYRENVTGLSAMVAYNLLLSIFPFVFLVLFIFSQVLRIDGVDAGVVADLQRLFPDAEQQTLNDVLQSIRSNSATIGVVAALGSIWIGASFWGAMDTAFCRIYHVQCRGWWEQKRFSLAMLFVVALFILGSVVLPAAEGALIRSTDNLPFGLNEVQNLDSLVLVSVTLSLNFLVCAMIYWLVPKGHMPWRAVWPGAIFATVVAGLANWLFPVYLANLSTLSRFGSTLGFILVALLWFYLVALTLLAGAVINSLRHECYETGRLPYGIVSRSAALHADPPTAEIELPMAAEPYRSLTAPIERPPAERSPEGGAAPQSGDEPITIRAGRARD